MNVHTCAANMPARTPLDSNSKAACDYEQSEIQVVILKGGEYWVLGQNLACYHQGSWDFCVLDFTCGQQEKPAAGKAQRAPEPLQDSLIAGANIPTHGPSGTAVQIDVDRGDIDPCSDAPRY